MGFMVVIVLAATLVAYTVFGGLREDEGAERWPWGPTLGVGLLEFLALWPATWIAATLLGWMLIWGDNRPPPDAYLVWFALGVAVAMASVACFRMTLGLAARSYARGIVLFSAALILIVAYLLVAHRFRGGLHVYLLVYVACIGAAAVVWGLVYRKQIRRRQISLAAMLSLTGLFAAGLGLATYLAN